MIHVLNTEDFGKIEIDSRERTVFFQRGDYLYDLSPTDEFTDFFGRTFRVVWGFYGRDSAPILEMRQYRAIK